MLSAAWLEWVAQIRRVAAARGRRTGCRARRQAGGGAQQSGERLAGVRQHAQGAGSSAILPDLSARKVSTTRSQTRPATDRSRDRAKRLGWQSRDGRQNDRVKLEFVSRQHHDDDVKLADPRQKRREPRLVPVVKNHRQVLAAGAEPAIAAADIGQAVLALGDVRLLSEDRVAYRAAQDLARGESAWPPRKVRGS